MEPYLQSHDSARGRRASLSTVLLVEEDDDLRSLLGQTLADWKYEVLATSNAIKATDLWNLYRQHIGLVITDVKMRGMNGPCLVELLIADNPDLKIIFISGGSSEKVQWLMAKYDQIMFLPKPFTIEDLAMTLNSVVSGRSNADDRRSTFF